VQHDGITRVALVRLGGRTFWLLADWVSGLTADISAVAIATMIDSLTTLSIVMILFFAISINDAGWSRYEVRHATKGWRFGHSM